MDRLRIIICLVLCVAIGEASTVRAQSATPASALVAVAGDVLRPNTYAQSPQIRLCLRDVLAAAGMISEQATALIVRPSGGYMQSSETVTRGSAAPGPQLNPGDVVIVSAVGQIETPTIRSAAILFGGQAYVLSLEDERVSVGDTLTQFQIPPQLAEQVQLISSTNGRTRRNVALDERLMHGDILIADRSASATGSGNQRSGFAPRTFEWGPARSESPSETIPAAPAARGTAASGDFSGRVPLNASGDPFVFLPIPPETNSAAGALSLSNRTSLSQQSAPAAQDRAASRTTNDSASDSLPSASPLSPATPPDPFRTIGSQPRIEARTASLQSPTDEPVVAADSVPIINAGSAEVAPVPPQENPVVLTAAPGIGLWNAVFVVGMLLAGGMIIAGWLKSEAELRQHEMQALPSAGRFAPEIIREQPAFSNNSGTTFPQVRTPKAASTISSPVAEADEEKLPTTVLESVTSPTVTMRRSEQLVALHEWMGGEWLERHAKTRESAPPTPPVTATDELIGEAKSASPAAAVAARTIDHFPEPVAAGATREVTSLGTLNDLIENRLPVDLCSARLPLQIRLHGRPSGPRKLRIDAAHTQLAGPHGPLGSDRRKSETRTPAAVSAGLHASDSAGPASVAAQTASDGPTDRRPSGGSLDRALNFLHGQGE